MLILLKFLCLFIGFMYFYSNTAKLIRGQEIDTIPMVLMSLGIVGFVFMQFKLYL